MIWSPSRVREQLLALAMSRILDGAAGEASALRKLAREDALTDERSVFEKVSLIVGPIRAERLITECRS